MTKQIFISILICTIAFLSCRSVYGQGNNKKTVAVVPAVGESVSKYSETSYLISYKMINVKSSEIVNVGSETVRDSVDGLLTTTEDIAKKLFGGDMINYQPANTTNQGIVINGVKWATCNVDAPGTFAANLEDAGMFYQWNRKKAWAATGNVTGWDGSIPTGTAWEKANDPSPAGWRVPTLDEFKTLLDKNKVSSVWTTENGVNGIKFTDKATDNSIFLPAAGFRYGSDGTLFDDGSHGYYWSSTQDGSDSACDLYFYSGSVDWGYRYCHVGFTVRSVAE